MIRKINGISYNPPFRLTTVTYSPGSTETILNYALIPASTLQTYDILGIQTRVIKTTGLSGPTIRIRVGGLTTSATQVAIFSTTATSSAIQMDRRLSIQNITTDTKVVNTTANLNTDIALSSTFSVSTLSIDWTQNQYIVVTATSSVGEVLNCGYIITDLIQSVDPS